MAECNTKMKVCAIVSLMVLCVIICLAKRPNGLHPPECPEETFTKVLRDRTAVINHLWFGKSLKEAIDTPVVYVGCENKMNFEPKFDITVIKELEALGLELGNKFYNVVNAVEKNHGYICAVSDERKLGKAAGY